MKIRNNINGTVYEVDDTQDLLLPYDRSLKIYEETAAAHGITPGVKEWKIDFHQYREPLDFFTAEFLRHQVWLMTITRPVTYFDSYKILSVA